MITMPVFSAFRSRTVLRLVLGTAGLSLAACGGASDGAADGAGEPSATADMLDTATLSADAVKIAGFVVDTARIQPWQANITVPGRLELDPNALETIGSITEGRITHVTVRVGDRVSAGQALVMVHSHEIMDARSALKAGTARVTAMQAERDLAVTAADRAQRLFDNKAMSRAELERAQVARRVAESNLEQAAAERDRADALVEHLAGKGPLPAGADEHDVIVRTPIGGVVTGRDAQPGTVVLPGTPLVTVGSPDRLQLEMHVPEQQSAGIDVGATVRYALTDRPDQYFDATVIRVAPTVDTLTRTVQIIAQLKGKPAGRAETFVQATIRGRGTTPALVIPASAVQALEGDTVVFVAEPRGEGMQVKATPVRVGRRSAEQAEVLAGLDAGKAVVVRGAAIAKAELLKRRSGGGE